MGPVWFLTGKWDESPVIATRHCTIPAGKYLFLPVASTSADNVGFSPPKTVDELRALCKQATEYYENPKCWLDGRELQGVNSVADSPYRVLSPVYSYRTPAGNVHGYAPGSVVYPVVADGIFLMLEPLAAGPHTIRFTASSLSGADNYDMTYHVDILPPKN